ncbi:hypothetical protein DL98DRAFT_265392 [Cadophora sp. DSE1049]|nr:hypothetical protein DL98DRAFT_265392 [Cadophora sp. DSE1049]
MREAHIRWPEAGGLLVIEGDESQIAAELIMLRMVTMMEERCHLLRHKFSAVFYENPDSYTGFEELGPRSISQDEDEEEEDDGKEEGDKDEGDSSNNDKSIVGQSPGS